jgi:hypothetical protein
MIGSVVVASNRDVSLLDACLTSLHPAVRRSGIQLIVVRPVDTAPSFAELRGLYPYAIFVEAAARSGIPHLRGIGLSRAGGRATGVTEDHCLASDGWVDTLSRGMAGADVVGGAIGNAQFRSVDWGAYFAEYGLFGSTRPEASSSEMPLLSGANVAYAENVRPRVAEWATQGVWENVVHARLHDAGHVLRFVRDAHILQNERYDFRGFCRDRYEHGRNYALVRYEGRSRAVRWVSAMTKPALAILLTARVGRASAALDPPAFMRALPYTCAFLTSWATGEAMGCLRASAQKQR